MKLSVIIPNYNNACYLEQCVRSVLSQTYSIHEIVIVDDGSTDDSRQVISELEKEDIRIKAVFMDKNSGVSVARNTGFVRSTGDYVTFLDADDYYYSTKKIEKEMQLIQFWKQQGKDIVAYSKTVHINSEGKVLGKKREKIIFFSQGKVSTDFISGFRFNTIPRDYCISRKAFVAAGTYSYPINFYEDLDLLIRIALKFDFYYTGEEGTAHRITGRGLSNRSREEHVAAKKKIREHYFNDLSTKDKMVVTIKKWFVKMKEYVKRACLKNTRIN